MTKPILCLTTLCTLLLVSPLSASPRNIYGVGSVRNPSGVTGSSNAFGARRMSNPSGVSGSRNVITVPRNTANFSGVRSSPFGNGSGIGRNLFGRGAAIQNSFGVGRGYFGSTRTKRSPAVDTSPAQSDDDFRSDSGELFSEEHDHSGDIFTHF